MEDQIFQLSYALDTFYFLICGALVMWMAAGFSMLEAGLVRSKNTAEILTKNIALYAVACTMYMVCGYAIMYPELGSSLLAGITGDGVAGGDSADPAAGDAAADAASADAEGQDPDPAEKFAELEDRYLRLAAEFENFKRRSLKERHDLLSFGTENLIKELLATVDNLERAVGHAQQQEEEPEKENILEGIELTFRSLMQSLKKHGVDMVEAEGAVFDPKVHEAMRQVSSDEHEAGTVVEVFQRGYQLRGRLLRPALVSVAGPGSGKSDE